MLKELEENIEIILPKEGLTSKLKEAEEMSRPLIIGGAVQIDSVKQLNPELSVDLNPGVKIKLGKRTYLKVV